MARPELTLAPEDGDTIMCVDNSTNGVDEPDSDEVEDTTEEEIYSDSSDALPGLISESDYLSFTDPDH